ncbi:hypothetical protein DRH14_01910 [Candidatus Shapirobacteria bacterium]|nr:MAG: hypothetical protein DRH14_01910 [Candidatus Shapirobacteria bacterium]
MFSKIKKFLHQKVFYINNFNLLLIIVFLNLIIQFFPNLKLDLTANHLHTLSPATKKIIKNLDDVVNLKFYVSSQLPSQFKSLSQDLNHLLDACHQLNPSKFIVTRLNPDKDESIKNQAIKDGVQPLNFSSLKQDKFEISTAFFALMLSYGDKNQLLPITTDIDNSEYYLLSAIKQLTSDQKPTFCLTSGHGELDYSQTSLLHRYLGQLYQIEDLDLSDPDQQIADDVSLILSLGPQQAFDQDSIDQISQYIAQKKAFILFIDSVNLDVNLSSQPLNHPHIEKLLSKYGIKLLPKVVADTSSLIANFKSAKGPFLTQYPFWLKILPSTFNPDIPAVSSLSQLSVYWPSALEISDPAQVLFSSSSHSWLVDGQQSSFNPTQISRPKSTDSHSYPLSAINTQDAKLAVVADTDLLKDNFVANDPSSLALLMNLVDYFSADDSLLTVRAKNFAIAPILPLEHQQQQIVRWINLALPLLILLILFFLLRFWRKRYHQSLTL